MGLADRLLVLLKVPTDVEDVQCGAAFEGKGFEALDQLWRAIGTGRFLQLAMQTEWRQRQPLPEADRGARGYLGTRL
jgi:hypothetical protein